MGLYAWGYIGEKKVQGHFFRPVGSSEFLPFKRTIIVVTMGKAYSLEILNISLLIHVS